MGGPEHKGRHQGFSDGFLDLITLKSGEAVQAGVVQGPDLDWANVLRFAPAYVLDATELGDLLPLLPIPYVSGAESRDQTGEPHARAESPAPHLTQSFTCPFAVDFCPGQDHTIPRPPNYERHRDEQPYTLTLQYARGERTYRFFETAGDLPGSFWAYRRLLCADQFAEGQVPGDVALINWQGNDYTGGTLIDVPPAEQAQQIAAAKELSLGLLYWLQTEVPRDDGGHGYPELRLRPDIMGTADGFSLHPVEWNIGEAAGALAAFCLGQQRTPADVCSSAALLPSVPADLAGGWCAAVLVRGRAA